MKFRKSFCWTPRFHCVTFGGSKSNTVGLSPRVGSGSPPADVSSCNRPHWSVELSTPGALAIMSNTMLPCGRS